MSERAYCVTVRVKPEGCEIMVLLENQLSLNDVITKIEEGLESEYRRMNDVTAWCFHWDNQRVTPGMLKSCNRVRLERWLRGQAAVAFSWEVSTEDTA